MSEIKLIYSREEMKKINIETLQSRGVEINDIALVAFNQQSKYMKNIQMEDCIESVLKVLSYRDVFHHVQFGAEVDRLVEEKQFKGPIQNIMYNDLGLFGVDEVIGLDLAGIYGVTGKTNFGEIDINKPGIVDKLNEEGKKEGKCHTFLDDIVGAIAASAATRVAQMMCEKMAK